jgi:hypothetical protein
LGKAGARCPGPKALALVPNAGHDPKQLCPKGLDRNDLGAAFHPIEIALQSRGRGTISDVPCGEAFSVQTTHFITFKTAS